MAKGLEPASNTLTAPAEIKFAYDDGDLSVQKSFTFDRNSYVVGVQTAVYQKGVQVTAFPMWPAGFGSDMNGPQYASAQIVYQYDDKVERLAIKKISGNGTLPGPFNWAGILPISISRQCSCRTTRGTLQW